MEKLIGSYRWNNWIVILGNNKTRVVARPKNLIIKIKDTQEELMFEGEQDGLITVIGSKDQLKQFIDSLRVRYAV
jgi:hypothetical protein